MPIKVLGPVLPKAPSEDPRYSDFVAYMLTLPGVDVEPIQQLIVLVAYANAASE